MDYMIDLSCGFMEDEELGIDAPGENRGVGRLRRRGDRKR